MKLLVITNVNFDVMGQQIVIFSISVSYWKKWGYNGTFHQLFIDFKKVYDSLRGEVLYNILTEFTIPRKLIGLIIMCVNYMYSTACLDRNLAYNFPIQNSLKEEDALSPLLLNFALQCAVRWV
jgi:hypothetical protein